MLPDDFRACMRQLADPTQREAVRAALLQADEDAVDPLVAEFHAGVSEEIGAVIINIVGEIGGPDALTLLRYVYHFEEGKPLWRAACIKALLRNQHSLDSSEIEDLQRHDPS